MFEGHRVLLPMRVKCSDATEMGTAAGRLPPCPAALSLASRETRGRGRERGPSPGEG